MYVYVTELSSDFGVFKKGLLFIPAFLPGRGPRSSSAGLNLRGTQQCPWVFPNFDTSIPKDRDEYDDFSSPQNKKNHRFRKIRRAVYLDLLYKSSASWILDLKLTGVFNDSLTYHCHDTRLISANWLLMQLLPGSNESNGTALRFPFNLYLDWFQCK